MKNIYSLRWYLLGCLLCWTHLSFAQQISVQGKIMSETDDLPIIAASIVEKGTSNGTITDVDGNFTLSVNSSATIVISYVT